MSSFFAMWCNGPGPSCSVRAGQDMIASIYLCICWICKSFSLFLALWFIHWNGTALRQLRHFVELLYLALSSHNFYLATPHKKQLVTLSITFSFLCLIQFICYQAKHKTKTGRINITVLLTIKNLFKPISFEFGFQSWCHKETAAGTR